MRIFILIIVILTILGILESKSIIPSTSFGILSTLSMLAAFIKSLNIHSYYLIIPNITFTTSGILTTLLILFIVGYVLERFRTLEQNNIDLVKRIQKLKAAINASHANVEIEDNKKDNENGTISNNSESFTDNDTSKITEVIRNIRWLISEGYVTEFSDGKILIHPKAEANHSIKNEEKNTSKESSQSVESTEPATENTNASEEKTAVTSDSEASTSAN